MLQINEATWLQIIYELSGLCSFRVCMEGTFHSDEMSTKFETPMAITDGLQDMENSHSYSGPLCTASLSMALLDIPLVASPQRSWVPTAARAEAASTVALNAAPPKKSFNSSTSTKNLGATPKAGDGVLPTEQQSGAVMRNIEGSARSGESRVPAMGSPFPKFGWSRRQNSTKPPKQDVAGGRKVSIVWFRSDLRVHDNEVLTQAHAESSGVRVRPSGNNNEGLVGFLRIFWGV
jgi:hypothetical protein